MAKESKKIGIQIVTFQYDNLQRKQNECYNNAKYINVYKMKLKRAGKKNMFTIIQKNVFNQLSLKKNKKT